MKLIILGAPGCGKGTLSEQIVKNCNYKHISTGEILREEIANNSEIGKQAKNYMEKGQFVPDEIVIDVLRKRLEQLSCDNYILDGFPRNIIQAEMLDKIVKIDKVVLLDVDYQVIIDRITGRRICSDCKKIFNTSFYKDIECDVCKGILVQRTDDTREVISERLKVYESQTKPLIDFYAQKGVLVVVEAGKTAVETFEKFRNVVLEAK